MATRDHFNQSQVMVFCSTTHDTINQMGWWLQIIEFCFILTQWHTLSHTLTPKHSSTNPEFSRCSIFLLPFLSPGYCMFCESLMSRRCHSSQLFMAKFQSVCTLAARRERGGGAAEAGTEWTAPGRESGSRCERRLKGKVKAAAKLLSRCSIWQNLSVCLPSLSSRCFSAQVRRGHGRAAPSGLKSVVWLVKY